MSEAKADSVMVSSQQRSVISIQSWNYMTSQLNNSGFTSPDQVVIPIILPLYFKTLRCDQSDNLHHPCIVLRGVAVADWLQQLSNHVWLTH